MGWGRGLDVYETNLAGIFRTKVRSVLPVLVRFEGLPNRYLVILGKSLIIFRSRDKRRYCPIKFFVIDPVNVTSHSPVPTTDLRRTLKIFLGLRVRRGSG